MKKAIALFMAIMLLLSVGACAEDSTDVQLGSSNPATVPASTKQTTVPTVTLTTVPTAVPTTMPTIVPTTIPTTVPSTKTTTAPTTKQATTAATTIKPPLAPVVKPTGPAYVYNDERAEMMDSTIFRGLKYLGYDRAGELEHKGLLFEPGYTAVELEEAYKNGELENYPLTQIFYANGAYGTAIRPAKPGEATKTGNVPDVEQYVKKGIVCTSFVDYYYFAYLRNIEGVKVGHIISAFNKTRDTVIYDGWVVDHWTKTAELLVEEGQASVQRFDFTDCLPPAEGEEKSEGFIRYEEMFETLPIGALIRFGREGNHNTHFAIYAGTYKGIHYMIHMGSDRGPEIAPLSNSFRADRETKSYPMEFYVIEGTCETNS